MRILIDTNILVDCITKREPFFNNSKKVIELCFNDEIEGCLASHTILNLHYILRKQFTIEERSKLLLAFYDFFTVINSDNPKIVEALKNTSFKDFEDCLQYECAKEVNANYIITRNTKDYQSNSIPAITPEEFLKEFEAH